MKYKVPKKAVITDAGFSSRFSPITKTVPKGMLPIGNKPAMQLCVEECAEAGIEEIIIVATKEGCKVYKDYFHNKADHVKRQLRLQGKLDRFESVEDVLKLPEIFIIEQDASLPYGNGSSILSAKPYLKEDEAFVILYSDDLIFGKRGSVSKLIEDYERFSAVSDDVVAVMAGQRIKGREIEKYGVMEFIDGEERLKGIVEKPKFEEAPSESANPGRYLMTPKLFEYLTPMNTEKDDELWMVDAVDGMIKDGFGVYASENPDGVWYTTGDPKSYLLAQIKNAVLNESLKDDLDDFLKTN